MAKSERPTRAELEEDRFVEWIMQAADFVKERMQFVVAAVAALVVIVVLVSYMRKRRGKNTHGSVGKVRPGSDG